MSARSTNHTLLALVLSAAVQTTGCGDPIKEAQLIEENRVLGARVEVDGEPDRATPAPGENATVRWLVADPAERRPLSWAMAVCEAVPVARGIPQCQSAPFADLESGEPRLAEPVFEFTLPAVSQLSGAARLVVLGIICADGVARRGKSWDQTYCAGDDAQATLVSLYVTVRGEGTENANPSLSELRVQFDGAPWPAAEPGVFELVDCADAPPDLTRVAAGSGEHRVELQPDPQSRELLVDDPLGRTRETLQLSHFCTAGDLERPFSVLEGETVAPSVGVFWTSPGSASQAGDLVRFYLVARDLRGGVGWAERALCVVPQAGD